MWGSFIIPMVGLVSACQALSVSMPIIIPTTIVEVIRQLNQLDFSIFMLISLQACNYAQKRSFDVLFLRP